VTGPSAVRGDHDAESPDLASTGPTRVDRIRRRVANHPVGALVVLVIGVIGTVGGTIGGVREIADVFDGSTGRPAPTKAAVRLSPSELKTAKNSRYGFSFQYPVTWQRSDPVNGDGLAAMGPEPGLELVAYGRLPSFGPSPVDVYERLDYQVRELADAPGSRVTEDPIQQNVTRFLSGGETTEMAGNRFVMQTDATGEAPSLTTVALVTTTAERDVEMLCTVPTRLSARWRGACNQLISTLTLTR
jgi:hypothetical protein